MSQLSLSYDYANETQLWDLQETSIFFALGAGTYFISQPALKQERSESFPRPQVIGSNESI